MQLILGWRRSLVGASIDLRREFPGLVSIALGFVAYIMLAPPHVLGGDNGEFVALAQAPGIAHPPGYPLYVLYLRLMSWLPGEAARPSALATSILGGFQLIFLYVAARSWKAPPLASGIAVACYSASALAAHLNSHAEVFALNGLLAAALLFLSGERCRLSPSLQLFGSGLCFGLGFSNHHTLVFMLPLLPICVISASRRQSLSKPFSLVRLFAFVIFGGLVGLSPNLLLIPWSQQDGVIFSSWGEIRGFTDLARHFLRSDYGTLRLSKTGEAIDLLGQESLLFDSLYWTWHLLLPVAVIGLIIPWVREKAWSLSWWRCAALLACFISAGPLFVSMFNIASVGPPRPAVLERFHLLPALLLVGPVASGLAVLNGWILRRLPSSTSRDSSAISGGWLASISALIVAFAFAFSAIVARSRLQDRQSTEVDNYLNNSLKSVPFHGIVLVRGDHRLFGGAYLQVAAKYRRDVAFVAVPHWRHLWYRSRLGLAGSSEKGGLLAFVRNSLSQGKMVFADPVVARSPELQGGGLRSYQLGVYRRLLLPGDLTPHPEQLLQANEEIFRSYDFNAPPVERADGWPMAVRIEYGIAWRDLAADLNRLGRSDLASIALRRATEYGPCLDEHCQVPRTTRALGRSN